MPPHYTAHYAITLFTNKRMVADAIENKEQRSGNPLDTLPFINARPPAQGLFFLEKNLVVPD